MKRPYQPATQKAIKDLGILIKDARESQGLSQSELGQYAGVSDKSISAYENGRSQPPIDILSKLAHYTNKPISYFIHEEKKDKKEILEKIAGIQKDIKEIAKLIESLPNNP